MNNKVEELIKAKAEEMCPLYDDDGRMILNKNDNIRRGWYSAGATWALSNEELLKEARLSKEEWVSVEDRKPNKNEIVMTWDGENITLDAWGDLYESPVSFSSATIRVGEGWQEGDQYHITHWQPLPSPPTK